MRRFAILPAALALGLAGMGRAEGPEPAPATRPEMKQLLEDWKKAKPRLPLPPPTAEERKAADGRPLVNNARMRMKYLPAEVRGGDFVRGPDPAMTLDPTFKTRLFWIVSRANNCQYCLGHQELKLAADGMAEDRIAALDCDWDRYPAAERAAFEAARRLTYEPYRFGAADWERLRKHYTDAQSLEIVFTVANNNATNRWTGGLGIPQDGDSSALMKAIGKQGEFRTLATPTSPEFRDRPSQVAPPPRRSRAGSPGRRPDLETRAQAEEALAAALRREPRLALADADKARALPAGEASGPAPEWVRLLAHFPKAGAARVASLRAADAKGSLAPLLKAQVAWVAAREDRAWYALGHAKRRLLALGQTEDDAYALDGPGDTRPAGERAALTLARKLTSYPEEVTDADVEAVRKHYRDAEVAELVLLVCNAAFFDRVTEAANLRLEKP